MKVYISKHISGGYLLNFPSSEDTFYRAIKPFSVWPNNPSIEGCVELEFPTHDLPIEAFKNFVQFTAGSMLIDMEIETI